MVSGGIANLKPHQWKSGESGNIKGRPRNVLSLTTEVRKYLAEHPEEIKNIVVNAVQMVTKHHNVQALVEIWNRLDGKVTERHEIDARLPVTLVFQPVLAPGRDAPERLSNENLGVLPPDAVDDMPLALDVGKEGQDFDLTEQNGQDSHEMEVELSQDDDSFMPNPAALGGCIDPARV